MQMGCIKSNKILAVNQALEVLIVQCVKNNDKQVGNKIILNNNRDY